MAGLGLSQSLGDAIDIYRSGVRENADAASRKQDQDYKTSQRARETMMQGREDGLYNLDQQANTAAQSVLQSRRQPQGLAIAGSQMPAGQDGQEQSGLAMPTQAQAAPRSLSKQDYLAAFDAQSSVYGNAGNVQKMMEVEAKSHPLRTEIRNEGLGQALASYNAHQDPVRLAKEAYPLIRDGNEIASSETTPAGITFTMKDGTKSSPMAPDLIAHQVQAAMLNSGKVAEMEFESRLKQMESEGKGRQDRLTEEQKAAAARVLEGDKGKNALGLAGVNNDASLLRTQQQGTNSLAVANIGARATLGAATIRSAADAGAPSPSLSVGAVNNAARRYNTDGTLPPLGMGAAGNAIRMQVLERADELSGPGGENQRVDQLANKASASALSNLVKSRAMVSSFERNANSNIDIALGLSAQNDRTGIPMINAGLQAWREGTGSPEATRFAAANQTIVSEYAKIMSGGMGNSPVAVSSQKKASELLKTSMTPKQYSGNVALLKQEMANRITGMAEEEKGLRASMSTGVGPANTHAATVAPSGSAQIPSAATPRSAAPAQGAISVMLPNGQSASFGSEADAAAFRKKAGL